MTRELQKELVARRGYALPLHRTPWWLRWRGPWRIVSTTSVDRWVYLTRADYREIFGRESI